MLEIVAAEKYVRSDVQGSRLGDEIVFFDDRVGKYFSTGSVGADIWEMLESPTDFDTICAKLLDMYDIDDQTCRAQAFAFLGKMIEIELIETVKDS